MDMLKKIFPFSFKEKKDIAALIINILLYLVGDIIAGFVIGLLASIPLIGIVFSLVGSLVGLYCLAGLVLSCLDYFKVLK